MKLFHIQIRTCLWVFLLRVTFSYRCCNLTDISMRQSHSYYSCKSQQLCQIIISSPSMLQYEHCALRYAIHILRSSECCAVAVFRAYYKKNAQLAQNHTVISWKLHRERRQKWINAHMLGVKYTVNENTSIYENVYLYADACCKIALCLYGMMYVWCGGCSQQQQRKCFIYFYGVCWKM